MNTSSATPFARWPDVPACYDWLSLDRRGGWRLQGEPVTHAGLLRFLNDNYTSDDAGNWLVHNGPQRVYVTLDYTPWVLRLQPDGNLVAHTGAAAGAVDAVHLDDEGNVLLHTALGIGLLDDRDLQAFLAACVGGDGAPVDDDGWVALMAGEGKAFWCGLPLALIARDEVPARYGFRARPAP
ncbi:DUF2946 family protein [Azoarcus sp. KH32C]|uniref:DUF2946 family protein n=1 Tax=Azoarcus sp. KH32C TaxID=748247 RepID=UPI0002386D37|nr:DUF2946 family protein [Azoarcus sp. KH32C]BAL22798.1 hypothetical protein AZKH_0452 [Azoarcus sp. KH32C]